MKIFQKGFNFGQDGPGNRLVYHVAGCNMHCPWCSNPEGMKIGDNFVEYTADEIAREAVGCKPMFFGGGGVTFTGGEATLDSYALEAVLKRLAECDINTAIETNGTSACLDEIVQNVDYLIMDFKHYDSDVMRIYTGIGNEMIKSNFEKICESGRQFHVRIPLINRFNADAPELFAEYFSQYANESVEFEFLKYHEYGKEKWRAEYKITDGFVSDDTVERFKRVFCEYGLKCITT